MTEEMVPEIAVGVGLGLADRLVGGVIRQLQPNPLDLVFDRNLSGCVHGGAIYNAVTGARLSGQWLRVGITNRSRGEVDKVRVQALSLKPDTLGLLPLQLHRKDDNPKLGQQFEQWTTVPPSKTPVIFIDVVSYLDDSPAFQLEHLIPDIDRHFPAGSYELELVVTAAGFTQRRRKFEVNLVNGKLDLRRIK